MNQSQGEMGRRKDEAERGREERAQGQSLDAKNRQDAWEASRSSLPRGMIDQMATAYRAGWVNSSLMTLSKR